MGENFWNWFRIDPLNVNSMVSVSSILYYYLYTSIICDYFDNFCHVIITASVENSFIPFRWHVNRGLLQWWDCIALSQHKLFFCLWPFRFLGEVGNNLVSPPNMCSSGEYYSYNWAQKEGGISIECLAVSAQTERSLSCTQLKMWQAVLKPFLMGFF